jgi:hypothetical protein
MSTSSTNASEAFDLLPEHLVAMRKRISLHQHVLHALDQHKKPAVERSRPELAEHEALLQCQIARQSQQPQLKRLRPPSMRHGHDHRNCFYRLRSYAPRLQMLLSMLRQPAMRAKQQLL